METILPDAWHLTSEQWVETVTAVAIFVGALLVALIVPVVVGALVRRRARLGRSEAMTIVVHALRAPFGLLVVVQALFVALRTLSYLQPDWHVIQRLWLASTIAIVVYAAQHVVVRLVQWYEARQAAAGAPVDAGTQTQRRRAVNAVIWIVGGLVVLDTLGVEISPLLAGLGLGGLAVALALQPMLGNVFASTYLLADRSIRVGDAIEVPNGPSGVIEDIGWRATRLRTADRRVAIVPNSVLAQGTLINLDATTGGADVVLRFRVRATADLAQVERWCVEALAQVRDEAPDLVVADAPISCRYQGVLDGRAEFEVRLRALSWREVGDVRHRVVLRVHSRLGAAGIVLT